MGLFEILKGEQPGIIKTVLNYENAGQFGEYSTEYALTNHNLPGELVILKNIYGNTAQKRCGIKASVVKYGHG